MPPAPALLVAAMLMAPLGLALGGCGFSPVYATQSGAPTGAEVGSRAAEALSAVHVPVMPERTGMMLRQALQDRLQRFGVKPASRYDLLAQYRFSGDSAGIEANSNITRLRYYGSSTWYLTDASSGAIVTQGYARTVSGADVFDSQFFANELQNEVIQRQLAEELAEQIVAAMASYFEHPPPPKPVADGTPG